jgi:hypothetical protein
MSNTQFPTDSTRVSEQLPYDVRMALVKAAQTKDPVQRAAAIEAVQAMARARFPYLFQR